jgi:hypothetical protein
VASERCVARRAPRAAALMVIGVVAALCFTSSAMANSGRLTANCNFDGLSMLRGPHVRIESGDLLPLPGYNEQWVATKEYVYNYESRTFTAGDWNIYPATRTGTTITVGGPDFWLGQGWYAAYVVAYAWNPNTRSWGCPTINQYVPFEEGGWWCRGR